MGGPSTYDAVMTLTVGGEAPFLTARWSNLLMMNWEVPALILQPYLPRGVELDLYGGRCFVSVVAFQFLDTRVLRVAVPWHRDFPEVNLRFYVKRTVGGAVRRGAVFIREYVPRFWIAFIARALYNERYSRVSMREEVRSSDGDLFARYQWRKEGRWHIAGVSCRGEPESLVANSREEFIAEHYFGYSRQRDGSTVEYQLSHPRWRVWRDVSLTLDWQPELSYGSALGVALAGPPAFSFMAEGSEVAVSHGRLLSPEE